MNLIQLRKDIHTIDKKIVTLLIKRQSYMPAVGRYKKQNKLKIDQPQKEREILVKLKEAARKGSLNQELVESIFKKIFKDSKKIQKSV